MSLFKVFFSLGKWEREKVVASETLVKIINKKKTFKTMENRNFIKWQKKKLSFKILFSTLSGLKRRRKIRAFIEFK
jgi:hypothetical protein